MTAAWRHDAPPRENLREQAARWALRQRDDAALNDAAQAEMQAWRAADHANAQALDEALHALQLLDRAAGTADLMALRADALAARPAQHRRALWPLAAVGAVVLAVAASWFMAGRTDPAATLALAPVVPVQTRANSYVTGIGERATVGLPDGSVVILNTDTELEVDYRADERVVHLLRGQALFEVAKDAARPFRVLAANTRITAVGTEFDVRIDRTRLQVALLHGVVKVDGAAPDAAGTPATRMVAGEVLDVLDDHQMRLTRGDPQRISGWRDGQVVFDDESLANAVAEMNRYSTRPIQLDAQIAQRYYVSGVFKTGDTDRFAQALVELFPLRLTHDDAGRPLIGASALTKDSQ